MNKHLHRKRHRGATLVFVALWMGIALAALMVLDIGYLVWQKRELQKIADLSALAGAVRPLNNYCESDVPGSAQSIGLANGMDLGVDQYQAVAGKWEPIANTSKENYFQSNSSEDDANACHFKISRQINYFFIIPSSSENRRIEAKATAVVSNQPMASVVLRTTTASLKDGVLNALLKAVTGSQIGLDLIGWKGIANLNVNLLKMFDSLLDANIGIGSYEQLLKTELSLVSVLKAAVSAVEPKSFLDVDLGYLKQLSNLNLGSVKIKLGDLIKLDNVGPNSALDMGISALDLVQGALQVAAKDKAIGLDIGLLGTSNGVLDPKADNSVLTVKLKVIEPPKLAIIGNPNKAGVVVEARTAQVRLWIQIKPFQGVLQLIGTLLDFLKDLVLGILNIVFGLLGSATVELQPLVGLTVDLLVEAASGHAKVDAPICESNERKMNVSVRQALIDVYIGKISGLTSAEREANALGSKSIPVLSDISLVKIRRTCFLCPVYLDEISLGGKLSVGEERETVVFSGEEINSFREGDLVNNPRKYHRVLTKIVGKVSELLTGINLVKINVKDSSGQQTVEIVGELVGSVLKNLLSILDFLGPIINGLLNVLGVRLNDMEVAPYLDCGSSSELVY